MKIKFAKVRDGAKIPTKEKENLGYDVYADFKTQYMIINPNQVKMIPTGIASIIEDGYGIIIKERGSTGSKGLAVRCGVIDSNYRGEWFIALNNTSEKPIVIAKAEYEEEIEKLLDTNNLSDCTTIYPYEKAIAQAVIIPNIVADVETITYEELQADETSRGDGKLGSSGK